VNDRTILHPDETAHELAATAFTHVGDKLLGRYRTADFVASVQLLEAVTEAAEALNHHPDVQLGWGRISFELSSHDVGGVTQRDLQLALEIDRIARGLWAEPQ
jgi:4a-hydroxytetrahydrobiopterin dehydratase